jgi:hypothetical protein
MRQGLGRRGVWASGWLKKPIKPFNLIKPIKPSDRVDLFEPFKLFNRFERSFRRRMSG